MFDNTNMHAMCMLEHDGTIITWNKSAQLLTGYAEHEALGKKYATLMIGGSADRASFAKALIATSRKGLSMLEGTRERKDKSTYWASTFITRIDGSPSARSGFVLVSQDISEARRVEQKREAYIGIASHELRNPITTLSLYSELLARELEQNHDKKNLRMMRDIQSQTARLVTLIDDLLIVNKLEGGKLSLDKQTFDIVPVMKKILKDFRVLSPGHRIVLSSPERCMVTADKNKIAQVVVNLLTNAIKYSPNAAIVDVTIRMCKKKCEVAVRDFGNGIDSKDLASIFTRFYRTKDAESSHTSGSGLGLFISREVLKRHRERLWVKSAKGKGTTFFFTLSP